MPNINSYTLQELEKNKGGKFSNYTRTTLYGTTTIAYDHIHRSAVFEEVKNDSLFPALGGKMKV